MLPDKMKNFKLTRGQKIALGLGVAALGGLLIYRYIQKGSGGDKETSSGATPVDANQAYLDKVKALQVLVGVTADGIIGPKTKAALSKYGLPTTISASNIDSVLNSAQGKVSETQKNDARYRLGRVIFDAFGSGKGSTIVPKEKITLNQWATDATGKLVVTKKDSGVLSAGSNYRINKMYIFSDGFLLVKFAFGDQVWNGRISPYSINLF